MPSEDAQARTDAPEAGGSPDRPGIGRGVARRLRRPGSRRPTDDAVVVVRPRRREGRAGTGADRDGRRRLRRRRGRVRLSLARTQARLPVRRVLRPAPARGRLRPIARAAIRPDDRQRLVLRRPAHRARARRPPDPLGATGDLHRRLRVDRGRAVARRRADCRVPRRRLAPRSSDRVVGADGRGRPDRAAGRQRPADRPARLVPADRAERQARRPWRRGSGPRSLLGRGDPAAPGRGRRPAARGGAGRTARLGLLRQPRGVRGRLDARTAGRVRAAARLRSVAAAAPAHGRRARGGRAPDRLLSDPDRAGRGELRRGLPRMGRRSRGAVPDPGVRGAAGDGQQQPARRPDRGRGLGLDRADPDPLGLLRRPSLRPRRDLVGDLDLGPLPLVPGHAARSQGRGARALPARHQPVRRARLAVFGAGRTRSRLVFLRLRRAGRPQSVVAGDAATECVPDPAELAAPAGPAGGRREDLSARRRRLSHSRRGAGSVEADPQAPRSGGAAGDPLRRLRLRPGRRHRAGRARSGDRAGRCAAVSTDLAGGGAVLAGRRAAGRWQRDRDRFARLCRRGGGDGRDLRGDLAAGAAAGRLVLRVERRDRRRAPQPRRAPTSISWPTPAARCGPSS